MRSFPFRNEDFGPHCGRRFRDILFSAFFWLPLLLLVSSYGRLDAATSEWASLPGSIKDVASSKTALTGPHKAFISRASLRSNESNAAMVIEVVLKMHNLAEL